MIFLEVESIITGLRSNSQASFRVTIILAQRDNKGMHAWVMYPLRM